MMKKTKLDLLPEEDLQQLMKEAFAAKPGDEHLSACYPLMCECGECLLWPMDVEVLQCPECERVLKMVDGPPIEDLKRRLGQWCAAKAKKRQS